LGKGCGLAVRSTRGSRLSHAGTGAEAGRAAGWEEGRSMVVALGGKGG